MGDMADEAVDRIVWWGDYRVGRRNRRTVAPRGSDLAKARIAAHQALDSIWKFDFMTRSEAYAWLARQMDVAPANCHIGMFNEEQCRRAISLCDAYRPDPAAE